jgi:hypothetical protein
MSARKKENDYRRQHATEHAGTVLCVERNEARLHGEACAEAQTQRTVPVVFGLSCLALTPVILSEVTPKPKDLISLSYCRWDRPHDNPNLSN